jgi:S-adenosylmethionine-dependent methyltransferase
MPKKKKRTLSPDYPRHPDEVIAGWNAIGWQITGKTGAGVSRLLARKTPTT